ncbi:acyl-CoA transferase/carnitine dehydratase [Cladochytrium replicatum]|nr:acyl-CoA transferase/carnitine dehydratase [Cladochytrium replicatum]
MAAENSNGTAARVEEMRARMLRGERERAATDNFDLIGELSKLLQEHGLSPDSCGGSVNFLKKDPLMSTQFRLGGSAALGLAMQAVVACHIFRLRGGPGQDISIDLGQAIRRIAPISERRWELLNNTPVGTPDTGLFHQFLFYKTKDERHVMLTNMYTGMRARLTGVLGCSDSPTSLRKAVSKYTADELEVLGEKYGFVAAKVRSIEEFVKEPVFDYLAALPIIEIERIAGGPPVPFSDFCDGTHPLSGIRALGMGHVIAGAGVGRSLAAYGADCLNIWRIDEEEHEQIYLSANTGVRSCMIDVRSNSGREQVYELLRGADVFYANRRPGLLESLGMDAHAASKIHPGIVHVSVSCHGENGPWKNRVGFDQIAGAVTGCLVAEGGSLETPKLPPTNIVNDYLGAWMAATGAMLALIRRAKEGGSYKVHVSLDRIAMWIAGLGFMDPKYVNQTVGTGGDHELVDPQLLTAVTSLGVYQCTTEQVMLSRTPTHFAHVISARGTDVPVWLPKPKAHKPNSAIFLERIKRVTVPHVPPKM